jgi:hypothetical protein
MVQCQYYSVLVWCAVQTANTHVTIGTDVAEMAGPVVAWDDAGSFGHSQVLMANACAIAHSCIVNQIPNGPTDRLCLSACYTKRHRVEDS